MVRSEHNEGPDAQRVSRRAFAASLPWAAATAAQAARGESPFPQVEAGQPIFGDVERRAQCIDRAIDRLRHMGQIEDGSFGRQAGVGVTALVTTAILRHGRTTRDPVVGRALEFLTAQSQPDGGIYSTGGALANYETCVALVCLKEADPGTQYAPLIDAAERFVRGQQWNESSGHGPADVVYGGAGYGKKKRPDLSNTTFLVDALSACGRGADDPAVQKSLVFISRCQNLESSHNATQFAVRVGDGGFYYTCAVGGGSAAGQTESGGLRSYASMTYAGLKSMIHAGLEAEDPRVAAAIAWLRRHYDLTTNAGLGDAGLYYYYHTVAKALDAAGCWSFEDASGAAHDWRSELSAELLGRQRSDGAWVNANSRWMEGDPNLVTAYALLALAHC